MLTGKSTCFAQRNLHLFHQHSALDSGGFTRVHSDMLVLGEIDYKPVLDSGPQAVAAARWHEGNICLGRMLNLVSPSEAKAVKAVHLMIDLLL